MAISLLATTSLILCEYPLHIIWAMSLLMYLSLTSHGNYMLQFLTHLFPSCTRMLIFVAIPMADLARTSSREAIDLL